jgi:hypothetical protein
MTAGLLPFNTALQLSALLPKLDQRFYSLLGQKVGRLWKKNPGKVNPKKIDFGNSALSYPYFQP